jgi:hypothetical protein
MAVDQSLSQEFLIDTLLEWHIRIALQGQTPYAVCRSADGLGKKDIMRCLKRYTSRETSTANSPRSSEA